MPLLRDYGGGGGSTDPFIDDPTSGPHKAGGGYTGPYSPFAGFGTSGGGGGGYFGASSPYSSYGGYGTAPMKRRKPGASFMRPGGVPSPAPAGPYAGGGGGGGSPSPMSYGDTLLGRFGGTPDEPWSHASGTDAEALLDMIIAGKAPGPWGPMGDPGVMSAYDRDATRRGLDMENAAVMGATYDGADPWTKSLARTMARNNASGGRWDFFNANRLDQARAYDNRRDFALRHKVGEYDTQREREAYLADKDHDESRAGSFGHFVGDLAGAAVGGLAGGGFQNPFRSGQSGLRGGTRYNYLGSGTNWR